MRPRAILKWKRSRLMAGVAQSMCNRLRVKVTVVPILRAGLGMLDGVLDLVPSAKISVVGLYTMKKPSNPSPTFDKFVDALDERIALIIDPMLATGGSMVTTIDLLKRKGCKNIRAVVMVAAPEGESCQCSPPRCGYLLGLAR